MISVTGLTIGYGTGAVISGLDFSVAGGELVWLKGPNGSGKTTLLRFLAGRLPASAGEIGRSVNARPVLLEGSVALYPMLTTAEHIDLICRLTRSTVDTESALTLLSLSKQAHTLVRELSLGQRQRLALTLALVQPSSLLLLDEPLNALDSNSILLLVQLLRDRAAAGDGVVFASHNELMEEAATRVVDLGPFASDRSHS